jgi:hypothetical protein
LSSGPKIGPAEGLPAKIQFSARLRCALFGLVLFVVMGGPARVAGQGGVPGLPAAPTITAPPRSVAAAKDSPVTLTVVGQGSPAPVYLWFKDGVIVPGQSGPVLTLERVQPIDAGIYVVTLTNASGTITSSAATITVTADLAAKSVARWWNEALLDGIRKDTPNPPVHARNLFHLSATLWDAFWAYEREGWAAHHEVFTREVVAIPLDESARVAAQQQAMSFAAYTVLRQRFANSPGAAATLAGIRWLMQRYGYNPDDTDTTAATPAAVGLRIGARVLALNLTDGANEAGGYANASGFVTANPPLVVRFTGVGTRRRSQPLAAARSPQHDHAKRPRPRRRRAALRRRQREDHAHVFPRAPRRRFLADDPGPPPTLTFDRATLSRRLSRCSPTPRNSPPPTAPRSIFPPANCSTIPSAPMPVAATP